MSEWIDFKAVRRDLNFEKVLVAYGVRLNIRDTPKGRQHNGLCPLNACKGKSSKGFSANVDQGIWRCFGCGSHGNTLDFILFCEGLSPVKGADVRRGAIIAQEKFLGRKAATTTAPVSKPGRNEETPTQAAYSKTLINEPLDFALKSLDPSHGWFKAHELLPQTVEHFGLGAASRGHLKDKIAIPLHDDATGKLIGYAGRHVEDRQAAGKDTHYLFPEPRIRSGIRHVFNRSRFLYNGHAVKAPVNRILVVADMEMVWWLWQHGYGNVVSTMGEDCEDAQAKRAVSFLNPGGMLAVLAREDEDGTRFAREVMAMCAISCAVRWYATAEEPLTLDAIALQSLLGLAETSVP